MVIMTIKVGGWLVWLAETCHARREEAGMKLVCSMHTMVRIAVWSAILGFLLGIACVITLH
jgi:hypothetical protein